MTTSQSHKHGQQPLETRRDLSAVIVDLVSGGRDSWTIEGTIPPQNLDELALEASVTGPGLINITISQEKKLWRVVGDLEISVGLPCSRCLNEYTLALMVTVDRLFSAGPDPARSFGQTEMEKDVVFLETGEFSPLRFAEEELILILPMFPLCSTECPGLCQYCGADKNQEPCGCPTEEKDNPFTILGKMKID